jgi:hypothetical protein
VKRDLALWTGVLAGPVVWAISFVVRVFIGGWVCVYPWKAALFAITLLALLLSAGGGLLAWSQWRQVGREYPGEEGGAIARARTMALAGVALNAGFLIVVIAQSLPDFMLGGCE